VFLLACFVCGVLVVVEDLFFEVLIFDRFFNFLLTFFEKKRISELHGVPCNKTEENARIPVRFGQIFG
jgi:hypothetical protein